jgi:hypothetical protein
MRSGHLGRLGSQGGGEGGDVDDAMGVDRATAPETDAGDLQTTGDARVDRALLQLEALDAVDVTDHPARYDAIHRALTEALVDAPADEPAQ